MRRSFPVLLLVLLLFIARSDGRAQDPIDLSIVPVDLPGLAGLQSFAVAQDGDDWLLFGGRLDGLHRRQPWASFDLAGHNDLFYVVNIDSQTVETADMTALPVSVREQLRSTNMQFHQRGDVLYVLGGYGYSETAGDHITFPNITAIDVPGLIQAIRSGSPLAPHVRQQTDARFAVTGGYLQSIDGTFHLVGGHRFDGRYNPMGGPSHTQTYTNALARFGIDDDGTTLTITDYGQTIDAAAFHRRDYNVAPRILPDGSQGLVAYSGVFQQTEDLPFLDCVLIDDTSHSIHPTFEQYYNHYHCAHLAMYSDETQRMHTIFFGGIAQYVDSAGIRVRDDDVPFVRTIARVTIHPDGSMEEIVLPVEMPGLLGAGSEFIPRADAPVLASDVIDLDALPTGDSVLVGHVFGGIHSSAANIFWVNDGTQSEASDVLYEVWLKRTGGSVDTTGLRGAGSDAPGLQLLPNPSTEAIGLRIRVPRNTPYHVRVRDVAGREVLHHDALSMAPTGTWSRVMLPGSEGLPAGTYYVELEAGDAATVQRFVRR